MAKRLNFQTEEYYHIYNRGVDKREIFSDNYDYIRFLEGLKEFNQIETVGSLRDLKIKRELDENSGPTRAFRILCREWAAIHGIIIIDIKDQVRFFRENSRQSILIHKNI